MDRLRFGILSTASINGSGFIPFAEEIEGVEAFAVASRELERARVYAGKYDIPRWYGSYGELIEDPDIDCVYISTPPALHAELSVRSLEAGKHVLCEKPVAMNAGEAGEIRAAAEESGLVFAEALHNRYHPLTEKILDLVQQGEIGDLQSIRAAFDVLLLDFSKIQFSRELGGGALMDVGCYPLSFCRWLAGCDKAEVRSARALKSPVDRVDLATKAELEFDTGVEARINCSLVRPPRQFARIRGTGGTITAFNFLHPVVEKAGFHVPIYLVTLVNRSGFHNIRVSGRCTYYHQLIAFRDAVLSGISIANGPDEAVANMTLIDKIFDTM